jgi:hypothetical protein
VAFRHLKGEHTTLLGIRLSKYREFVFYFCFCFWLYLLLLRSWFINLSSINIIIFLITPLFWKLIPPSKISETFTELKTP